ncbi:MAG: ABC transporter substrate-binding protein [Rhizobiaceae bacterium]|jgi:NitT/TauT family transport system substrate-binding protein
MKTLIRLAAGFAALAAISFAGSGPASALDKVVLRINFTPWAMHSQYFAAKAQGFYADEGIDIDIRPVSSGQTVEALVAGGEQFGLDNADAFVKAKANDLPIVAIMADQPNTPTAVITLKKSNITKPADLKGKKISWFQANVKSQLDPLLERGGLTRDDIEYVNVTRGSEVQLLAAGTLDAIWGYAYGQAPTLEQKGFPVNIMPMKDYGLISYGTVIFTTQALMKDNPDLVKRFLRATLKGYLWAHDHQKEAVAEVIKVAPDRNLELETKKLGIIFGLYNAKDYADRFGEMSDDKWAKTIKFLGEDLPVKPDPSKMYTNEFVDSLDETHQLAEVIQGQAK